MNTEASATLVLNSNEFAAILAEVSGKPIHYKVVLPGEAIQGMIHLYEKLLSKL